MHTLARFVLLVFAAAPLCAPVSAQTAAPAPAPAANSSLHGVLRDALTHRPLAGATVQLVWMVPHAKIPRGTSTTTLANGTFNFSKLAQHPYFVAVDAPKYLRQSFFQSELGEGELTLLPGKDRAVELAVTPEAAIEGTIVDAAGAAVSGVTVAAIRERTVHGVETYDYMDDGSHVTGKPAETDAAGHYRVAGLPAGTYAVLAILDRLQTPYAPAAVKAQDNGSLPIYLGGGFSLSHAARLTLTAGMAQRANFKLTPHKRHMIRGTVRFAKPPGQDFDEPLVSMDEPFDGPRNFQPWTMAFDKKKGTYEIGPLVPGDYDLTMATGVYFEKDEFARKPITVADMDLDHVDLTLAPRFSLNVKVTTNRILPRGEKALLLRLHRDGEPFLEAGIPIDRSGALAFPNLEPGHYTLHLFAQEPYTLGSARFAGQDVLAHGLTLKGTPEGFLEVTLAHTPAPVH